MAIKAFLLFEDSSRTQEIDTFRFEPTRPGEKTTETIIIENQLNTEIDIKDAQILIWNDQDQSYMPTQTVSGANVSIDDIPETISANEFDRILLSAELTADNMPMKARLKITSSYIIEP